LAAPDFLADLSNAISRFHDFTIQRHGGLAGFRDEGLFRFSVERPWMTAFGELIYKTPFQKAAAIAEAIVRNHPFNDGNHRTALAAAELVLGLHDMRFVAPADEKRDAIRELGIGTLGQDAFGAWLEQNSVLRTQLPD
jgi:death-on-curing protein